MLLPPSYIASAKLQLIKESEEDEENQANRTDSDTNFNLLVTRCHSYQNES